MDIKEKQKKYYIDNRDNYYSKQNSVIGIIKK